MGATRKMKTHIHSSNKQQAKEKATAIPSRSFHCRSALDCLEHKQQKQKEPLHLYCTTTKKKEKKKPNKKKTNVFSSRFELETFSVLG